MDNTIAIFSPKDVPFGRLSNNSYHPMRIPISATSHATVQYPTVTNYIYSKIMKTPAYSDVLSRFKPVKDVQQTFDELYDQQNASILDRAVSKALADKFKKNEELKSLLLATANAPIFYVSNNPTLGTGETNNGKNLYGNRLMQLRHEYRVANTEKSAEQAKVSQEQLIYDTYMAQGVLTKMLRDGKDINEFTNMTPSEIIDRLGRSDLQKASAQRDSVLKLAYKGALTDVMRITKRPENLVLDVRKREIRRLRLVKLKKRKELVFDMYADYLLKKHYPTIEEHQFAKAKEQQFTKLPWQQKNDLENRLFTLYEEGMLSSTLSTRIDENLALIIVPSEEEVTEAEGVDLDYTDNPDAPKEPYIPETGEPVLVYPVSSSDTNIDPKYRPYTVFSPVAIGMIRVDNRCFPTVAHYTTFVLLEQLPILIADAPKDSLAEAAYQQILLVPGKTQVEGIASFAPIDTVSHRYRNLNDMNYAEALVSAAKEGLDYKFRDRVLQDLLVSTGNAALVWSDFTNPILGVEKGRRSSTDNFVGQYLMRLRTQFAKDRKSEHVDKVTTDDISAVINKDEFMTWWVQMRVGDMCRAISTLKQYLWVKDEIDQDINSDFVTTVLDEVYQPCSQLFGQVDRVTADAPAYFRLMVQGCPGFNAVSQEIVELLWKRVVIMIYYLVQHMENATIQNIRTALGQVEGLLSKQVPCLPPTLPDENDNCIVSALINLIAGIVTFNKRLSYDSTVTEGDVHVAASIILNADVSEQIKPVQPVSGDWPGMIDPYEFDDDFDKKDPDFIIPGDGDDDSGDDDGQYGDLPDDDDSGDDAGFSPKNNLIIPLLKDIPEVTDADTIARTIDAAIDTIKTHPNPTPAVKQNRINFFATLR